MLSIILFQSLALMTPDTLEFAGPKIVLIVNEEVIRISDVYVVKYNDSMVVDSLHGYYYVGAFFFPQPDFTDFMTALGDSSTLHLPLSGLKSHYEQAPTEYEFVIQYDDSYLDSDVFRVYQFENMSISHFRKKRRIRKKTGFFLTVTNYQRKIEVSDYID